MQAAPRIVDAVQRIKVAFEVPDLRLSVDEATRIAGIDSAVCTVILEALEDGRFLSRQDGHFVRRES
jgi:hypothetical protein